MTQINAYLSFNGGCREAMNFYKECLGGELTLQTAEGTPMEAQCAGALKDQIMHASLVKDGLIILGTDMTGPEGFIKGNNMALCVNCSTEEEINQFFASLSTGGKIIDPLRDQFWGATFGVLVDKFGICWMFNYYKNSAN